MDAHSNSRSLVPTRPTHSAHANAAPEAAMHIQDMYYVFFRHKWKISICTLLGIIGAVGVYFLHQPMFESEAKLFIRYVVTEGKSLSPAGSEEVRKSPDMRGETIMKSEVEVLNNMDLVRQVVEVVGAEKILAKEGGGKDSSLAAVIIKRELKVTIPEDSSVIRIVFRHRDPEMVQPVLRALIDAYLKKHQEIHRAMGMVGDFLTQETDQLRARLVQTEDELRKARNKAGVVSLDEAKKNYSTQISHLREQLFNAQAELAERSVVLQDRLKRAAAITKSADTPEEATGVVPPPPLVIPPPAQIEEYQTISARLSFLQGKAQQLLTQFTEENAQVKQLRAQIGEVEQSKRDLEEKYPAFVPTKSTVTATPAPPSPTQPGFDLQAEASRLPALEARIKTLTQQIDAVKAEVATVDQMELTLLELGRRKELEESNYRFYAASLERSRINEALGAGKVSNISQIQVPSPPHIDSAKINKLIGGLAAGGLGLGLAWAFLIEFYLDRSARTPTDIERKLGLRLFLSIPLQHTERRRRGSRKRRKSKEEAVPAAPKDGADPSPTSIALTTKPNDQSERLRPFHETLCDRLVGYFDQKNLKHRPKLVGVSGIGNGAGVTTIAAGLARALSETGDGNVLLVDMTAGQGSSQQFTNGKAICGLDAALLTRESAQVETNLYVVSDRPGGDRLSGILPHRFSKLIPKLKASDFDYVIFDMPPVSHISVTSRLAGFMDIALLVIESEKTDRDAIQRATTILTDSKADVGAILNKTRTYVPSWLHRDQLATV